MHTKNHRSKNKKKAPRRGETEAGQKGPAKTSRESRPCETGDQGPKRGPRQNGQRPVPVRTGKIGPRKIGPRPVPVGPDTKGLKPGRGKTGSIPFLLERENCPQKRRPKNRAASRPRGNRTLPPQTGPKNGATQILPAMKSVWQPSAFHGSSVKNSCARQRCWRDVGPEGPPQAARREAQRARRRTSHRRASERQAGRGSLPARCRRELPPHPQQRRPASGTLPPNLLEG